MTAAVSSIAILAALCLLCVSAMHFVCGRSQRPLPPEKISPVPTAHRPLCTGWQSHRKKQSGNMALLVLGFIVIALLSVFLLWFWLPLLIAALAGFVVFLLLAQPARLGWVFESRRARQDPARLIENGRLRTPVWMPFYAMLAALLATAAGWLTLFVLPDSLHPEQMMPMGTGLAGAVLVLVLVWLLGQLVTGFSLLRQGQDWNASRMSPVWWIWAAIAFVPAMLAIALLAPNQAGLKAWGQQLRGYDSMPVRITLAPLSQAEQASDRDAALLQLVEPLLVQGSRRISASMHSRHGTTHWTAAVPARYRLQDDVLEIRLAGRLNPSAMEVYAQVLQSLGEGDGAAVHWLAAVQCLPKPSAMAALSPSHRREQLAQKQACERQRRPLLSALAPRLQGQILQVEVLPPVHFRPWPWQREWQAVTLPEGDALEALSMLAQ